MADLDSFVKVEESDPAADFIAREQDALAALEDDENDVDTKYINSNHYEDLNGETPDHEVNGLNDIHVKGILNQTPNGEIKPEIVEKQVEPEKIRKWREDQQRLLEAKDEEEAKKKEELKEQAKREMEEWYSRYAEQLEKSKLNNRNAEKEWIAERDVETPGQEWEKIARMCDFNPKSARNTKDTSRMRSILLQLKQSPPSATLRNQ